MCKRKVSRNYWRHKKLHQRGLRPILMTTGATVLGHFPLVLVTGAGAEARNSIGIILVAGMLIGTLFTLFILPIIYAWLAEDRNQTTNTAIAQNDEVKSPILLSWLTT